MRFAIIENDIVTNIIEADADFAQHIGAVELPDGYGIEDKCVAGVWMTTEKPVLPSVLSEPLQLTDTDILKAQNKALADRLEFTEELIAEMAMIVYAE